VAELIESVADETEAGRLVGIDRIRAAAQTLGGVALRTPLVPFGRPEPGRPAIP
jgi:hypothetical protein